MATSGAPFAIHLRLTVLPFSPADRLISGDLSITGATEMYQMEHMYTFNSTQCMFLAQETPTMGYSVEVLLLDHNIHFNQLHGYRHCHIR